MVKKGDYVRTPRFLMVRIEDVYEDERAMRKNGYVETTHYDSNDCIICGKSIGENRMLFAACNKRKDWRMMRQVVKLEDAERIIADREKCRKEGMHCEDCILSRDDYKHYSCLNMHFAAKELLDRTNGEQLRPFKVRIVETYTHEDTVMAKDWRDAREQVEELWDEGEYETTGDQFTDVEYFVEEEQK